MLHVLGVEYNFLGGCPCENNQRRELELKIERYEKNINDQKTKLRELNKNK